jgi:exosortase
LNRPVHSDVLPVPEELSRDSEVPRTTRGVTPERISWPTVLWFGVLLIACYAPVLARLAEQWRTDEDMGHGFFVPLVVAYMLWKQREQLCESVSSPSGWGLALVIYASLQLTVATLGAELFLARTAFVLAVIGSFLYLGGTRLVRAAAFPLFLLFFMVPLPAILYNQITLPLQLLASRMAESVLMTIGIPVFREGNVLELAGQKLQIVEACSGIRSLLTLSFLSLVYGYFFERKLWIRAALFVATVPVALLANAGRVTLTGILGEVRPELARGVFHGLSGWAIFMIALALLVGVHQTMRGFLRVIHAKH